MKNLENFPCLLCFVLVLNNLCVFGLKEDDFCTLSDGATGICRPASICGGPFPGRRPVNCGFTSKENLVCCPRRSPRMIVSRAKMIRFDEVSCTFNGTFPMVCCPTASSTRPPLPEGTCQPRSFTYPKKGNVAYDKCVDYQQQVQPCVADLKAERRKRVNLCGAEGAGDRVVGGVDASPKEFPHMARIGFGALLVFVIWGAAGTLISERFVMTCAHCTYLNDIEANFIRLGVTTMTDEPSPGSILAVESIIRHEQYSPQYNYFDIAVIKLNQSAIMGAFTRPACLPHVDLQGPFTATGWGKTANKRSSNVLQKVTLDTYNTSLCDSIIRRTDQLIRGVDYEHQMCAGSFNDTRDTCTGDSGGPLQMLHPEFYCMYMVVGLTSFGKDCGHSGTPAVYTKVQYFLPWVISKVWS